MNADERTSADEHDLAQRVVSEMVAADAFSRWLGIELVAVAPREATVRMMVRRDMTNGFGVCHGGVTFSLADSALAFASNTAGMVTMSIDCSMTYPVAVSVGDLLTAVATEEAASGKLAYYRVQVTRQDLTVVALFRGTVYRTKRAHRAAEETRGMA